jgi:GH15 family glucan-1,4-alpha-glucosidase
VSLRAVAPEPESAAAPAAAEQPAYRDIRDYAVIGDCSGAALVGRDASIDWCALGRIDAEPVCCALLDARRGGFFRVEPAAVVDSARRYEPKTNVLHTDFTSPESVVRVTDFMVLGRTPDALRDDYASTVAPNWLVRTIAAARGKCDVTVTLRPSVGWGLRPARPRRTGASTIQWDGGALVSDAACAIDGDVVSVRLVLAPGERRSFVLAATPPPQADALLAAIPALLATTCAYWREWSAICRYDGRYGDAVGRSALALKLLTHAASGAIAAAATTSLPEQVGGERNWDYRYCWLRDATLTLFALAALGYDDEAARFSDFLFARGGADVFPGQIMYGVGGEDRLDERTLPLSGYRDSRPVRIGNDAYRQRQLDVFGEIMDWALLRQRLGWHFGERELRLLRSTVDFVAAHWREPDQGIWEMRNPPQHHVYSQIMSWVALDRAARLLGADGRYAAIAAEIRASINAHGTSADGALRQAFENSFVDAALLLAPVVDFPLSPTALEATIAAVQRRLQRGAAVHRYDGDDGVSGDEGAFLACSFWLVDALLFAGRVDEARELYERLLALANDVGLFAEQIDPRDCGFLGNFPQAFTHLALIHSAALFEIHDRYGAEGLKGSHADRMYRAVHATEASRSRWARLLQRVHAWLRRSSRASMLDLRRLKLVA